MKKFNECVRANLEGLEERVFGSRIEAMQELQKMNPKKVITYDRRCSEISIDNDTVFVQFRKQNGGFRFYVIEFWDSNCVGGYDTYVGRY